MAIASRTPGLIRLAVLAAAAVTASAIAACGSSNNQQDQANTGASTPTTTSTPSAPPKPPPPPPPPPMGKDEVEGLVRSVSGDTARLEQRDRAYATIDFTPQTMITELGPAQLTDVKPGSCVDVEPAAAPPGGAVTAKSVTIDPPIGGNCPPAHAPAPGQSPDIAGKVASVNGNTITVDGIGPDGKPAQTTVTVADTTSYSQHAVKDSQAIQNGKCLAARGTQAEGVLHATTIDIEPCPPMGRPHHHFHIPYIPGVPIPHIPAIPHIPHIP